MQHQLNMRRVAQLGSSLAVQHECQPHSRLHACHVRPPFMRFPDLLPPPDQHAPTVRQGTCSSPAKMPWYWGPSCARAGWCGDWPWQALPSSKPTAADTLDLWSLVQASHSHAGPLQQVCSGAVSCPATLGSLPWKTRDAALTREGCSAQQLPGCPYAQRAQTSAFQAKALLLRPPKQHCARHGGPP